VDIKKVAVELIRDYMGAVTADMYSDFYSKIDNATVLISITELLDEYLGSERAAEVLSKKGLKK
jgi:hypothetical protein